ncbi:MAG TPA: O-antigen ligase family protein, partial [Rhizobiaceae bacterium]|nr:O-antigen ligase family protein [Rhizobiaceae bacterium]
LGSLLFGRVRDDIGAWVGLFGSKNAFAAVAAGLAICSIALLLDRSASRLLRLAALAGLLSAGPVLVLAQSVGTMTIVLPAIAVAAVIMASRRMSGGQKVLAAIVVALVAVIGSMLLIVHGEALFANYLEFSGKDVTLTGRTDLWDVGRDLIGENPWLGLGYQAFWVQGNEMAEVLWAMFDIDARKGFNFHNTYINNAVEIGLVGVGLQVLLFYGAFFGVIGWALRAPCPENAFLAAFLAFLIAGSFIEVVVFFQFSIASIVAVAAFVYASRYREWRRESTRFSEPLRVTGDLMRLPRHPGSGQAWGARP